MSIKKKTLILIIFLIVVAASYIIYRNYLKKSETSDKTQTAEIEKIKSEDIRPLTTREKEKILKEISDGQPPRPLTEEEKNNILKEIAK